MVCPKSLADIDISNYEIVKRDAFRRNKEDCLTGDGIADRLARSMVFDFENKGSVSFSKGCLDAIGDPEYVLVLIHLEQKIMLLVKAEKGGGRSNKPKGYRVEKNEDGAYVMENCRAFLSKISELMGWHPASGTKMLFTGEEKESNMVFKLSDAVMLTTWSADELPDYVMNNAVGAATA